MRNREKRPSIAFRRRENAVNRTRNFTAEKYINKYIDATSQYFAPKFFY